MREKKLYITAIIGAIICFIGDNLLGHYVPADDFGNKLVGIDFSYEWANVNPNYFIAAGICGVVSLLLMSFGFYGIYRRIAVGNKAMGKTFMLAVYLFVSVGILYHNVFAVAAYVYNRLTAAGFSNAKDFSLDVFNKFILVGAPAAVGFVIMSALMFIAALKGYTYSHKWMCILNPLIIMGVCVGLAKILPRTAFINGVFSLGQQSLGFLLIFTTLLFTHISVKGFES